MPKCRSREVELHYETTGNAGDPVMILISGLGAQLTSWPIEVVERFVADGFHVVQLDNRDMGLSARLTGVTCPSQMDAVTKSVAGEPFDVPYRLADMADDVFAIADEVGADKIHVLGQSMGGMIAQWCAVLRPERVLSLTSIMSTTGRQDVSFPTPEAFALLMEPAAESREAYIAQALRAAQVYRGGAILLDEEAIGRIAGEEFDRDHNGEGFERQFAAVMRDGDERREKLATLEVPTLVVHGRLDPLVPFGAGEDTADVIPGAQLFPVEDMGHHISPPFVDLVCDAVLGHVKKAATGR